MYLLLDWASSSERIKCLKASFLYAVNEKKLTVFFMTFIVGNKRMIELKIWNVI